MANHPDRKEIEALIANGHDLADRARKMVEETRRVFAQRGITPENCMDELRRVGGEAAVRAVVRETEELKTAVEQELRRDRMHGARAGRTARAVQRRGGGI